jgi:endonuclease YncB( thermonuclease family)
MLQFKPRQSEIKEAPERWSIGVDRRHVSVYVVLALVAGLATGFGLGRYITRKESQAPSVTDQAPPPIRPATSDPSAAFHNVTRVLRADTIEVDTVGPVRMSGIETPDGKTPIEIYGVHGQRAVSYVEKTLLGQPVRLEFDTTSARNKDDSGQTLAYVYTRDGLLVNAEMVKQGLAFVHGAEQSRLASDFRALEREAMQAMRGVWGPTSPAVTPPAVTPPGVTAATSPKEDKPKKLSPLPPSALGENIPALSASQGSSLEPGVWVSASDKMYHKSGCTLLDKKKHSVSLSEAKSQGYTACSRCYASTLLKAP